MVLILLPQSGQKVKIRSPQLDQTEVSNYTYRTIHDYSVSALNAYHTGLWLKPLMR
mgnify:FL=1